MSPPLFINCLKEKQLDEDKISNSCNAVKVQFVLKGTCREWGKGLFNDLVGTCPWLWLWYDISHIWNFAMKNLWSMHQVVTCLLLYEWVDCYLMTMEYD